jgi:GNAT superfamily N-acetyltransferase
MECFNAPPWNDGWSREAARERLSDILTAGQFRGAVALAGSSVVGMLLGQRERWVAGYDFNLLEMCVDPASQRSGIGTRLLKHMIQALRMEHIGKVYLITAQAKRAAVEAIQWDIAARALELGLNVVLDFGFWSRRERDDFRARAAQMGAQTEIRFFDVPRPELLSRLAKRNAALPPGAVRVEAARLEEFIRMFEPPASDELLRAGAG